MGFSCKSCTSDDLLMQQRWTGAKGRLRREDCKFVKHDKLFSKWKILVGPADSGEQSSAAGAKEGKYHMQNVPVGQVGPGVYELGVTAPSWSKQRSTRALSTEDVIPVYIGQSANIIQRLQKHGLAAAHHDQPDPRSSNESVGSRSPRRVVQSGSSFSGELAKSSGSGPRLFSEVFALGSSIAFRWAHTDSKVVAEQVESELLAVFDYAWNKGNGNSSGSGKRRSRDILAKLFMAWPSKSTSLHRLLFSSKRSFWLFCGRRKAVGIKVALRKPQDTITSTNSSRSIMTNLCFLMTIRPQAGPTPSLDHLTCGAVTGKGNMPYNAPPLRGQKLCIQHYESNSLTRGVATTTKHLTMGRQPVKLQTEPVNLKSCSAKLLFATQTKACRKQAEAKEEKPVEMRKRHNSLSFNTWVKGDSADQRVHDSSDHMNARSTYNDKPQHQDSARRRVEHLSSKYASVPDHESKRR